MRLSLQHIIIASLPFVAVIIPIQQLHADWSMFPRYAVPSASRDYIASDVDPITRVGTEYAENFSDVVTTGRRYLDITWWGGRVAHPDPAQRQYYGAGDYFQLRIYRDASADTEPPRINISGGPANRRMLTVNAFRAGVGGTPNINQFTATQHSFNTNTLEYVFEYNLRLDLTAAQYSGFEINETWREGMHWLSVVETDRNTDSTDQYARWNWTLGAGEYLDYSASRSGADWWADNTYTIHNYGITRDSRAFSISAVPEPGSICLMACALTGFSFIRRRQKQSHAAV